MSALLVAHIAFAFYGLAGIALLARRQVAFLVTLAIGFGLQGVFQLLHAQQSGVFFPSALFDSAYALPWALAFLLLLTMAMQRAIQPWASGVTLVVFFALTALIASPVSGELPGPNKFSAWAPLYFLSFLLARACFYLAAWYALLFLARRLQTNHFHNFLVWGFILHSISQVTGSTWCFLGWAATFQWVHVHMQAAAIWCYYANYLHLRYIPFWTERRKAWYAVAGFGLVLLLGFSSSSLLHRLIH